MSIDAHQGCWCSPPSVGSNRAGGTPGGKVFAARRSPAQSQECAYQLDPRANPELGRSASEVGCHRGPRDPEFVGDDLGSVSKRGSLENLNLSHGQLCLGSRSRFVAVSDDVAPTVSVKVIDKGPAPSDHRSPQL